MPLMTPGMETDTCILALTRLVWLSNCYWHISNARSRPKGQAHMAGLRLRQRCLLKHFASAAVPHMPSNHVAGLAKAGHTAARGPGVQKTGCPRACRALAVNPWLRPGHCIQGALCRISKAIMRSEGKSKYLLEPSLRFYVLYLAVEIGSCRWLAAHFAAISQGYTNLYMISP